MRHLGSWTRWWCRWAPQTRRRRAAPACRGGVSSWSEPPPGKPQETWSPASESSLPPWWCRSTSLPLKQDECCCFLVYVTHTHTHAHRWRHTVTGTHWQCDNCICACAYTRTWTPTHADINIKCTEKDTAHDAQAAAQTCGQTSGACNGLFCFFFFREHAWQMMLGRRRGGREGGRTVGWMGGNHRQFKIRPGTFGLPKWVETY